MNSKDFQKKKLVIANWKMKLGIKESKQLAELLKFKIKTINFSNIELVICPSFVSLAAVSAVLIGAKIKLGAQDVFWETEGAYTGEISPRELKEVGCQCVILGHSERRENLGETDLMIHQKVKAALDNSLAPIFCVGETFAERQEGIKDYVIINQVVKALEGIKLSNKDKIIIAYEPVWVIGSGQAVQPAEAAATNQVIYQALLDLFPREIVQNSFRLIYGGSVDRFNINSFTSLPEIDGVLVGLASLKIEEFIEIIKNV